MRRFVVAICICLLMLPLGIAEKESPAPEGTPAPVTAAPALMELGGNLFLINGQNRISRTYVPEGLVKPDVQTRKKSLEKNILMTPEAASALEAMFAAALNEKGHTLYATSGYRSFGVQQILFNSKVDVVGSKEKASRRVAMPGTSEHQLGLAMDVQSPSQLNLNPNFGETPEGIWVGENAHRFGFIVRYQQRWREITGVVYEPWHVRYVGIAHATALYNLDIPLETYVEHARQLPEYVLTKGNNFLLEGLISQMIAGQTPDILSALRKADAEGQEPAMRAATLPFLPDGTSYEQAVWYAYPTPRPTSAPRVDEDEDTVLFIQAEGG